MGVRGLLVYCRDFRCSHCITLPHDTDRRAAAGAGERTLSATDVECVARNMWVALEFALQRKAVIDG